MKIYLDSDYQCHVQNTGNLQSIETSFFDGMCDAYIEGMRYVPQGESWTRSDGVVFHGEMIAPWRPYRELAMVQREYERKMILDMQTALNTLGVTVDG